MMDFLTLDVTVVYSCLLILTLTFLQCTPFFISGHPILRDASFDFVNI